MIQTGNTWEVKGSYKRWWKQDTWKRFFHQFLNIKDTNQVETKLDLDKNNDSR